MPMSYKKNDNGFFGSFGEHTAPQMGNPQKKIQFRAQRVLNGEWVEGDLVYFHGTTPCIQTNMRMEFGQYYCDAYEVNPETIEQVWIQN